MKKILTALFAVLLFGKVSGFNEIPEKMEYCGMELVIDADAPAEGPSSGFDAEMLEIFLEEAQEIVEETNSKLAEWQSNPSDTGPVKILQRGLHTLKGGARMSGVSALGDLAHEMENLYEGA